MVNSVERWREQFPLSSAREIACGWILRVGFFFIELIDALGFSDDSGCRCSRWPFGHRNL